MLVFKTVISASHQINGQKLLKKELMKANVKWLAIVLDL